MKNVPFSLMLLGAVALAIGGVTASRAATLSEPQTVFYGRIINRLSGQTYVLSEGTLSWRIRRSNGSLVTLTTKLQPVKDGIYSYRLNVPHAALALGLVGSTGNVPLRSVDDKHSHYLI